MSKAVFERNWAALQECRPDVARIMDGVAAEPECMLFQQPGCVPNVMVEGRPYYVGNITKYLDSNFKGLHIDRPKVALFLGAGLFYEVGYFIQRYAAQANLRHIIVVEKSPSMFSAALNASDLSQLIRDPHVSLFVGLSPQELLIAFRDLLRHNMELLVCAADTQPMFTYVSFHMSAAYYKAVQQSFVEALWIALQGYGNDPGDSLIGLENMLDNVDIILDNPGINQVRDAFPGGTAVVVAAGPSLRRSIDTLRKIQDRVLIIACDATLKYLLSEGIKPHLVTSLEREHEVQGFFDNLTDVDDVWMAACPVLYRHCIECYNGPKVMVYRAFDHFKWLGVDRGMLEIQLSSANMAYKIAEYMGCTAIALIGQDLAFGEDGSTHAVETPWTCEGEEIFDVPGNLAPTVKTTSFWHAINRAYQVDISQNKGRVATFNCTDGGAAIPGTYKARFADFVEHITRPCVGVVDALRSRLTCPSTSDDVERLKRLMDATEADIVRMIELCHTGKTATDWLASVEDDDAEACELCVAPRKEIIAMHNTWQVFLMHVLQSQQIAFELESVMTNRPRREIALAHEKWYRDTELLLRICLRSLQEGRKRVCQQR